jgi:putative addiction module killer protein
MATMKQTREFRAWLTAQPIEVQDRVRKAVRRLASGAFGDIKAVGGGVVEARIHNRGGLRIYFSGDVGSEIVLLLGGSKSDQQRDIQAAKRIFASCEK